MFQLNLRFFMYFHQLRTYHAMGLLQTTDKDYWRSVGCHRVFFMPFGTVLPALFGEGNVLGFEIIKIFRHATTFFFRVI